MQSRLALVQFHALALLHQVGQSVFCLNGWTYHLKAIFLKNCSLISRYYVSCMAIYISIDDFRLDHVLYVSCLWTPDCPSRGEG